MAHATHKIRLYPNKSQSAWLKKACGISRFVYNWALTEWSKQYEEFKQDNTKPKPSRFSLSNQLNKLKISDPNLKWLTETSDQPAQNALQDLDTAFKKFFKKQASYPCFKKAKSKRSFRQYIRGEVFVNDKLKLQKLKQPIKMAEQWRFAPDAKFLFLTVSEQNNKWYAAITAEIPDCALPKGLDSETVGIDLGITTLATLSNGQKLTKRKTNKKDKERLKRLQRRLSKKKKGSKNRLKAKTKLANLYEKIANRREHDIQTITTSLAKQYQNIVLESLNVKGMMKNHKLAAAISDASFYRFKSELTRKVLIRQGTVNEVNQWFPSSKLCSNCGAKNNALELKDRIWICTNCNAIHDRDVNAATNLKNAF